MIGFLLSVIYLTIGAVLFSWLATPEDSLFYKLSLLFFWPLVMFVFMLVSFGMSIILLYNRNHKQ